MNELKSLNQNVELVSQPDNSAGHLNEALKEVFDFSKPNQVRDRVLHTAGAVAAIAAFGALGTRLAGRAIGKCDAAELNELRAGSSQWNAGNFDYAKIAVAPESKARNSMWTDLSSAARSSKLEVDPNYRYFQQSRGGIQEIYRWPDNGKSLFKQEIDDVQKFSPNGNWLNSQRQNLIDEKVKGWFHERDDEISPQQALELMARRVRF